MATRASTELFGRHSKLYRDNVWTEIHLSSLAVALMDTIEFQRLDSIKQLGFSDAVYRGAKHTRFLHSVGTYAVARRLAQRVWENHRRFGLPAPIQSKERWDDVTEIVALSALLHDITHVPHGHALEDEHQGLYEKHDSLVSPRLWHTMYNELSGVARVFERNEPYFNWISNTDLRNLLFLIIKYHSLISPSTPPSPPGVKGFLEEIHDAKAKLAEGTSLVRDRDAAQRMLGFLETVYGNAKDMGLFEPYMTDLVSNTISADLIDYLARDTRETGLKFEYDERIEHYFVVEVETLTDERRLVLKLTADKGLKLDITSTMVELMGMRYSLAEKVYYHKTKVSADVMLGRLLSIVGQPPDLDPYQAGEAKAADTPDPNQVMGMGDEDIFAYCNRRVHQLKEAGETSTANAADDLLKLLRRRRLFKPVVIVPHNLSEVTMVRAQIPGITGGRRPLYDVLYDLFRKDLERREQIERKIDSLFEDDRRHVFIFCPAHKPQAKEAKTIVEVTPGEAKQMNLYLEEEQSPLPFAIKRRINVINQMYGELWKLFVFLHPNDYASAIIRHVIVVAFWDELRSLGLTVDDESIRRSMYPMLRTPIEVFAEWAKESSLWADDRISIVIENMSKNGPEWIANAMRVGRGIDDIPRYMTILYEDCLRGYYRAHQGQEVLHAPAGAIVNALQADPQGLLVERRAVGDTRERPAPHRSVLVRMGLLKRS